MKIKFEKEFTRKMYPIQMKFKIYPLLDKTVIAYQDIEIQNETIKVRFHIWDDLRQIFFAIYDFPDILVWSLKEKYENKVQK